MGSKGSGAEEASVRTHGSLGYWMKSSEWKRQVIKCHTILIPKLFIIEPILLIGLST